MMMAVKPNAGIAGGLAEFGVPGMSEAAGDGDAFKAIMADLTGSAEGDAPRVPPPDSEALARQLAALVAGGAAPAKASQTTRATAESDAGTSAEDGSAETDEEQAAAVPAVAGAPVAAATVPAETMPPALATPAATRTATPAATPAAPQAVTIDGEPASPAIPPALETGPGAVPSTASLRAVVTATATSATMPTAPIVDIGVSDTMSAIPTVKASVADAPAAPAEVEAALLAAVPAVRLTGTQSPKPGMVLVGNAAIERGDAGPSPATADAKPAAAAPNFLVSTILPLLPESLHSLILGPSAPTAAAAAMTGASQPLDTAEAMIEQHLDLAHEGEWLDQLAKDIARSAGNEGGLRFRLNPANLGSLHVEMTQGSAGAAIRMTADTETARAILAEAQPKLIAEARAQGVRIAESHVDLGSGGQQASTDQKRQDNFHQQQRFARTGSGDAVEAAEPATRTPHAAERYA